MDGKKIRDLRIKRGLSLSELAKLSGVSKSYLSFIERGKQTNPSIEVVEKIAAALQTDMQSILNVALPKKQTKGAPIDLDTDVIQLAIEMSKSNIDKEKLKRLIELLK
ncbi:helix-turn-helix domain-containing protein [Calidifontibacillus oryziterrae]|uniref:helix-turn-helix domain-containing protein n=1 Tax=Calidifontibacillus oryziterrae TaxID=1191699 RepID=UPI0002DE72AC|nr:helix-turn-helix transcriptional regulator [Calidifontibacillus oryziterrae]